MMRREARSDSVLPFQQLFSRIPFFCSESTHPKKSRCFFICMITVALLVSHFTVSVIAGTRYANSAAQYEKLPELSSSDDLVVSSIGSAGGPIIIEGKTMRKLIIKNIDSGSVIHVKNCKVSTVQFGVPTCVAMYGCGTTPKTTGTFVKNVNNVEVVIDRTTISGEVRAHSLSAEDSDDILVAFIKSTIQNFPDSNSVPQKSTNFIWLFVDVLLKSTIEFQTLNYRPVSIKERSTYFIMMGGEYSAIRLDSNNNKYVNFLFCKVKRSDGITAYKPVVTKALATGSTVCYENVCENCPDFPVQKKFKQVLQMREDPRTPTKTPEESISHTALSPSISTSLHATSSSSQNLTSSVSYSLSVFPSATTTNMPTTSTSSSESLRYNSSSLSYSNSKSITQPPFGSEGMPATPKKLLGDMFGNDEAAMAVDSGVMGSSYVSSLASGGVSTAVGYGTRSILFVKTLQCSEVFEEDEEEEAPSWMEGIVIPLGNSRNRYTVGTCIFTTAFLCSLIAFLEFAPRVFCGCKNSHKWRYSNTAIRIVSGFVSLAILVYPCTIIMLSVALFFKGADAAVKATGAVCILFILLVVLWMILSLTLRFGAIAEKRTQLLLSSEKRDSGRSEASGGDHSKAIADSRINEKKTTPSSLGSYRGRIEFRNVVADSYYVEKFGVLFEGCRDIEKLHLRAYYLEEVIVSVVLGVLAGVHATAIVCSVVAGLQILVSVLHCVYVCVVRPYQHRFDTVASSCNAVLQVAISVAIIVVLHYPVGMDVLGGLILLQRFSMIVELIFQCCLLYVSRQRKAFRQLSSLSSSSASSSFVGGIEERARGPHENGGVNGLRNEREEALLGAVPTAVVDTSGGGGSAMGKRNIGGENIEMSELPSTSCRTNPLNDPSL